MSAKRDMSLSTDMGTMSAVADMAYCSGGPGKWLRRVSRSRWRRVTVNTYGGRATCGI
jgi:hypothetical protein